MEETPNAQSIDRVDFTVIETAEKIVNKNTHLIVEFAKIHKNNELDNINSKKLQLAILRFAEMRFFAYLCELNERK